jgi:hypothetical protein
MADFYFCVFPRVFRLSEKFFREFPEKSSVVGDHTVVPAECSCLHSCCCLYSCRCLRSCVCLRSWCGQSCYCCHPCCCLLLASLLLRTSLLLLVSLMLLALLLLYCWLIPDFLTVAGLPAMTIDGVPGVVWRSCYCFCTCYCLRH